MKYLVAPEQDEMKVYPAWAWVNLGLHSLCGLEFHVENGLEGVILPFQPQGTVTTIQSLDWVTIKFVG